MSAGLGPRWVPGSLTSSWLSREIRVPGRAPAGVFFPLDTTNYQGLFYYWGTSEYTSGFVNPSGTVVTLSQSSQLDVRGPALATDRGGDGSQSAHTADAAGSWWKVDLGGVVSSRRLIATHVAVRQRQDVSSQYFQALLVEGSVDGSAWSTLGSASDGQLTEALGAWSVIALSGASVRYVRITQVGLNASGYNYFALGEVELFGTLTAASGVQASGGIESDSGGYRYHEFRTGGSLVVSAGGAADVLIVAGGGGGGASGSGGGGAGGVRQLSGVDLSVGTLTVTVGDGGAGGVYGGADAGTGGDSSVAGYTALGGGRGGNNTQAGGAGGSGGGGGRSSSVYAGGSGTTGQGNAGGSGNTSTGGGGGGAASAGVAATTVGGNGGAGVSVWGFSVGGGGGGGHDLSGSGGTATHGGGAGAGGGQSVGFAGTANTGGGGGGGGQNSPYTGGVGGSGVVVVRYPIA